MRRVEDEDEDEDEAEAEQGPKGGVDEGVGRSVWKMGSLEGCVPALVYLSRRVLPSLSLGQSLSRQNQERSTASLVRRRSACVLLAQIIRLVGPGASPGVARPDPRLGPASPPGGFCTGQAMTCAQAATDDDQARISVSRFTLGPNLLAHPAPPRPRRAGQRGQVQGRQVHLAASGRLGFSFPSIAPPCLLPLRSRSVSVCNSPRYSAPAGIGGWPQDEAGSTQLNPSIIRA